MNEHIKDIAENTGIHKLGLEDETAYWVLQNFAEALIRECAGVVFKNAGPRSALNVLEHFGLKEEE